MGKKATKTAKKSTTATKKAITIDANNLAVLDQLKEEMVAKLGGNITYNMVIQRLVADHTDLENTRQELIEIQKEAEETQVFLKELLLKAVERPSMPTFVPMPSPVATTTITSPPPPPPSNLTSPNQPPSTLPTTPPPIVQLPPVPKPYQPPPQTKDLRKDYHNEICAVFTGQVLKPSEVLKLAQPKHSTVKVETLSDQEASDRSQVTFHAEANAEKFKTIKSEFKAIIPKAEEDEAEIKRRTKEEIGDV